MLPAQPLAIVVFCYNEQVLIRRGIETMPKSVDRISIVDDKSTVGIHGQSAGAHGPDTRMQASAGRSPPATRPPLGTCIRARIRLRESTVDGDLEE
jgi:hypothetical protein